MPLRRFATIAAGLFLAALPATAQGPSSSAGLTPIAVTDCKLTTNWWYPSSTVYHSYAGAVGNLRWVTTSGLTITFRDRRPQKAVSIRFLVNYRGDVETIDDVGSFTTDVPITHHYDQFLDFAYLGTRPNYCRVISATFADGTTWTAAESRRQASE